MWKGQDGRTGTAHGHGCRQDAVRRAKKYFPQSIRVLCGKYSNTLRQVRRRAPHGATEESSPHHRPWRNAGAPSPKRKRLRTARPRLCNKCRHFPHPRLPAPGCPQAGRASSDGGREMPPRRPRNGTQRRPARRHCLSTRANHNRKMARSHKAKGKGRSNRKKAHWAWSRWSACRGVTRISSKRP